MLHSVKKSYAVGNPTLTYSTSLTKCESDYKVLRHRSTVRRKLFNSRHYSHCIYTQYSVLYERVRELGVGQRYLA